MRRADSAMEIADTTRNHARSGRRSLNGALDIKSLGVYTGNGLNELNCALVQYRQDAPNAPLRVQVLEHNKVPILPTVRLSLLNALRDVQSRSSTMPQFNAQLGYLFSSGIKTFCNKHAIKLGSIDLIGVHSSIVPARRRYPEEVSPTLHPFGWNATITAETGVTTIFDLAVLEHSASRLLASPSAFVDRLFLRHPSKFRACLNIGEIANLSFIPPLIENNSHSTITRDCGPGSLLIDYAMSYCTSNDHCEDNNGTYAARGTVNQDIVNRFLRSHDYLRALPPLSIAREMFGDHDGQRLLDECIYASMKEVDIIATVTRITAQNIVTQYRRLLAHYFPSGQQVDELFICGASAQNSNIIDYLEAELPESIITKPLDDIGIPGEANEAVCYAHLALETALAQATRPDASSSSSSSAPTGTSDARIRGTILRGEKWEDLSARVLRFSEGKQLHLTQDVRCAGNLETSIKGLGLRQ
ncbi:hypothetical protein T440DRAFT_68111 [Plenodomus tracheiphilus IPT5]|uniref:Uncharacterized protein n=1 Tax=Plenodomus tracheiphilus IPT5 TaxID=1408161 RepID=A0A6A7B727_9PLEO|nr:hypothetical protein T440DRAFT_68111 [Plenodomus tracheiphilus IPT5]